MPPPRLSRAQISPVLAAVATDESGTKRDINIAGEYPLTLYADKQEMITLMTLGQMPEALAIGWLRNQRVVLDFEEIAEVIVDWQVNAVAVRTTNGVLPLAAQRTTTSGCGQGTMFGDFMAHIQSVNFVRPQKLSAAALFNLLEQIRIRDTVYKNAGAVHACALAAADGDSCEVLVFAEDVGRHNAVDAIAGWMWIHNIVGDGKIFYTTGRLTSEMVIKCAQMKIPYLVSRSGLTRMGLETAKTADITMFGRAINRRYLLFCGEEYFVGGE